MKRFFTFLAALCLCSFAMMAESLLSTEFKTQEEFSQWTVIDANDDGTTWKFDDWASPSYVFYGYHSTNAADDWFITPAITPTESGIVAINFAVQGSSYGEKLEVKVGNSNTVEAMTTSVSDILTPPNEVVSYVYLMEVEANETYHIGFHAISDADKWRIFLCSVDVSFTDNPIDLQAVEFVSPVSNFGLDQETVTVKVRNTGWVAVNTFDISYSIDDETVVTETVNQTLAVGEEFEYTFTAKADLSTPRKNFFLKAWTTHEDDINPNNNLCHTAVLHKAPAAVPYFMGFEANEYTEGIQILNLNNDSGDWEIYTDPWYNLAHTGSFCLAYNYDKNNNANDWAFLEPITIEEAGYYVLKFWYSGDDNHPEKLGVYYGNAAAPESMTNKIVEYAPFARGAYEESINIIYIDQPQTIYIGFYAFSDKDENWLCVDDVSFEKVDGEAADIMVMPITNPIGFVHAGSKKDVKFKLRNIGIKNTTARVEVKINDDVVYNESVEVLAQEIKDIIVADALASLEPGTYTIAAQVYCDDDNNLENNAQTLTCKVVANPSLAWNFEDGQLPADFTYRVEDSGSINPSAGYEFNEYGWGIFNIGAHELYGEYMLAGTTWLDGTEKADRWLILPPVKPTEESCLVWDAASFNPNFLEDYAVMISSNGDDSWYYFTAEEYIQESADFKTRGIDLSEYAGQSIYIAFRLRSKNCEHLILDNIELYDVSKVELLEVKTSVDPAEGVVEKLDNFTVTFENIETVEIETYSFYPPYIASVSEDGTLSQIASAKATKVEGQANQISIAITQEDMTEITAEGKYALVIPRKDLIFNGDSKLLTTEPQFVYYYEIKGQSVVVEGLPISISPASGSTVKELQIITFEFSTTDYPNTMSYDGDKKPVLYNEAGEEVAVGNYGYADASTYMSLYVSFEEAITAEGTYKLVIPEGGMCEYPWGIDNPRQCPAMELTYTVGNAELQYSISVVPSPEDNVVLADMNQFTVTFEGVQKIDFSTEAWHGYALRVDEKGNTLEEFPATCNMISDVAYTVTLDREPTELGIYRLVIPEAAVIVLDNAGVSGPNAEATFDYNVTQTEVVVEGLPISISPASGSTVKEISVITLEFSLDDYPNGMSYDWERNPVLYNEAGEEVALGHFGIQDPITFKSLYISFDVPITEEGTYTLKIEEGNIHEYKFGIDNPRMCPAFDIVYTVGNAELQYNVTASPAPGTTIAVDELNQFTVTFEGVQKIDFSTEAWHGYVLRVDDKGNTLEEFPATCDMISDVAYTVTMDRAATEEGIYRLVIPEAAVIVLDNAGVSGPNAEVTFDYNVTYSGIGNIFAEATSFNVYTLNGVCLLTNAKAEDLKQLEKGIYIINGQKVFIR